jgi:hypothetical protein
MPHFTKINVKICLTCMILNSFELFFFIIKSKYSHEMNGLIDLHSKRVQFF